MVATLDLCIANDGKELTFSKAGRGSIIDVTFLSGSLSRHTTWEVGNDFTFSDHQALHFRTHDRLAKDLRPPKLTSPKWRDGNLDAPASNSYT
ncbi:hypothetical protein ACLKA6_003656 [Drosophila palustris]